MSTQPPTTKYELTVRVRGNSHEEIESELLTLARGGYLLDSDYYKRDEFDCTVGRVTARLEHTNPEQTPERYREELDGWETRTRDQSLYGARGKIDEALAICDQVEANPVGWGGDMAVSLARTIRAALAPQDPA